MIIINDYQLLIDNFVARFFSALNFAILDISCENYFYFNFIHVKISYLYVFFISLLCVFSTKHVWCAAVNKKKKNEWKLLRDKVPDAFSLNWYIDHFFFFNDIFIRIYLGREYWSFLFSFDDMFIYKISIFEIYCTTFICFKSCLKIGKLSIKWECVHCVYIVKIETIANLLCHQLRY